MNPAILSSNEEPFAYNLYPKYSKIQNWTSATIDQFCYDFYLFSEGKLEPQFGAYEDLKKNLENHKPYLNVYTAIKLAYMCFFPYKDKSNVKFIIDKQLKFHYFLNDVAVFYPQSKFIILSRDPRDNVLVKFLRAQKQKSKNNFWYFALSWNYEYGKLFKKAKQIGLERFIEIKYEDLVINSEKELRKICTFINAPYNEIMLQYHSSTKENIATNNTNSATVKKHIQLFHQGLTQKINTDKVGFWKENLTLEQANLIWNICGNLAQKIGYPANDNAKNSLSKENENQLTTNKKLFMYLKFFLIKKLIPFFYYNIPYSIKYCIKKILYSKNLKDNKYILHDFYKKTLPK